MSRDVVDVPAEQRYELRDGDERLGVVMYVDADAGPPPVRDLQHTIVEPHHRGEGVGDALVSGVLALVRADGFKIIPTCPFIRAYLEEHPDDRDLVS